MRQTLKAPFPYFGGKRKVADLVWRRFGDVPNYIEAFAGSAAMLLCRPSDPRIETLNDEDAYVANFWRAIHADPEGVAKYADWPVSEADLHSRHRWLVLSEPAVEFRQKMRTDPEYFDPKIAGWWCWGLCCWIGSGWCRDPDGTSALVAKRPHIGGSEDGTHYGKGVHAKGPDLRKKIPDLAGESGASGRGIHTSAMSNHRPQLADAFARGRGVHGNDSAGTCQQRREWLIDWFGKLADRLRTVRVCCGHWRRVCDSLSVTTRLGVTGLFLDPPYPTHAKDGAESRAGGLYANDGDRDDLDKLRDEVLAYCLERGPDPRMRIAVCGYDTDGYAELEGHGWEAVAWKTSGGYGNQSGKVNANAGRERIWFSPNCLKPVLQSNQLSFL